MIRGIRGATTVNENIEAEIVDETEKLLREMIHKNKVEPSAVTSIFVSVTEDITAAFPAKALRRIDGWTHVPIMCMREIPVPGSLSKCIRVMMHVNTIIPQEKIEHIYLEGATSLRPDLTKNKN